MLLKVTEKYDGSSVRDFLKIGKGFSSRLFSCLKRTDGIKRGGEIIQPFDKVFAGEEIEIIFPDSESGITAVQGALNILYEDEFLLAVDKPALMPCHPSLGHHGDTLANLVAGYFEKIKLNAAVRIPARIDSGTTGVVLFAKNEYIAERLAAKEINKTYVCVCEGNLPEKGEIKAPIGRAEGSIIKRCVCGDGKPAHTFFKKTAMCKNYSVAGVHIETGRTHQIRVHMAHIGHPLVGDWLYGKEEAGLSRHLLHLESIEFVHPVTEKKMIIKAEIPQDMKEFIEKNSELRIKGKQIV